MRDRKIAFVLILLLGLILGGDVVIGMVGFVGTGTGPVIPNVATFVVEATGPLYQAFLTIGTMVPTPFFTETNFTRLFNDDMLPSVYCMTGCDIALQAGVYNLTQTIVVNTPNVAIQGSPASIVRPRNVTGWNTFFFKAAIGLTSANTVLDGFTIDDASRVGTLNTGDTIVGSSASSGVLIRSMTIQNVTSNAINIQGTNYIVTTSTIQGPVPPAFTTNFGILMGSTARGIRIFLNSISRFNYTDTSAIQSASGASYISITSNDIFASSFGISSTWGKFLTITGNTIHNNYAAGILLTTLVVSSVVAGPAIISSNVIVDNAQEPGNDVVCNNLHCPGIMIRGTRPSWDNVAISGNTIKDTQANPTQQYAIYINSVQYSNLTITGNTVGKTRSGQTIVLNVNPLKTWIITANPGFNPQPIRGPLTAGATPFTYTNNDAYMEQIELITIGDMTAFTCKGIANIIQVDAISPVLNTLDTCVFTYVTIAPTYDVLPLQG